MAIGARFPGVLAAAGRGEDWAWAEIYRDLSPAVLGYLCGRGARDAEDLLGECFVHVVRNLARFEGDERAFRSWVFTIAHHRLVEHWRRSRLTPALGFSDDDVARRLDARPDPAAPDGALIQRASLVELLGNLPASQRDVLLLRVVNQFSIRETAAILGRTEAAVKLLHSRAVRAVQRSWAGRTSPRGVGSQPAHRPADSEAPADNNLAAT
jgi:RNA polymerase sigma-70 factor (ECF subfamily)